MQPRRKIELLDGDTLSIEQIERALDDLVTSHGRLFGYRAVRSALVPRLSASETTPGRTLSILDLGTGAGDVAPVLAHALARRGTTATFTGVDRKLAHLVAGRRRGYGGRRVVADLAALPFRDDAFDWTMSHLVFHHFADDANRRILASMLRLAPRAAIVDLARSRVACWLVPIALRAIGVGPVALADGILSIGQASTLAEVRELTSSLEAASALELRRRFPFRFSLILERAPLVAPDRQMRGLAPGTRR